MDAERPSGTETIEGVEIDYDRFDVAAIMAQVKRIAASRPVEPTPEDPSGTAEEPKPNPPAPVGAPSGAAAPSGPPSGRKAKIKAKLLRAMTPFFPIIRFFALPLHEEIQAAVRQIDAANRRLDALTERLDQRIDELSGRFDHRIDELSGRFDHRLHEFSDRVDFRLVDLDRSGEYIKLLHTLDHNLVVETTKLRIEFEALKSKVRILEKELESQVQRERTLEKRLLS